MDLSNRHREENCHYYSIETGDMTLHKKYVQKLLKHFAILLFFMCCSDSNVFAHDMGPPSNASQPTLNLLHEPIQPLRQAENLNAGKVALGESLFQDDRLGHDENMACASCHSLTGNGANHRHHTLGRDGAELDVNTLTVFNSSLNHQQFWDGRAQTLQQQIDFVVANKKEFATDWPSIIKKLKQDETYTKTFDKLYNDGITADNIRDAIATFERSLITTNSRFDRYLRGDSEAITDDEKEGYYLFKVYGCAACHQGSNVGGNLFIKLGVFKDYFSARRELTKADLGRFNVTSDEADRYVFRVPSLRLAALTAPYFHDGSVTTLEEAVKLMAKYQLGREISQQDVDYIVAFLKTLPGEYKGKLLTGEQPQQKPDATP